ncbi:MAG: hypothetical protein ACKVVT_15310 [Dehalococcoidia bacterium]
MARELGISLSRVKALISDSLTRLVLSNLVWRVDDLPAEGLQDVCLG